MPRAVRHNAMAKPMKRTVHLISGSRPVLSVGSIHVPSRKEGGAFSARNRHRWTRQCMQPAIARFPPPVCPRNPLTYTPPSCGGTTTLLLPFLNDLLFGVKNRRIWKPLQHDFHFSGFASLC